MVVLLVDTVLSLLFTFLIPPFIGIVAVLVILAGLGKTLGVRQKYVEILLGIFEYGKQRLAKKEKLFSPESNRNNDQYDYNSGLGDMAYKSGTQECQHYEQHEFQLSDTMGYICKGVEAIVDDEVTKRFAAEELTSWNFLTRTNVNYEFISVRLTVFWVMGFLFRYFVLFPLRVCTLFIGMCMLVVCTYVIGSMPNGPHKRSLNHCVSMFCFDYLGGVLSLVCRYHHRENIPKKGICVANHTTPIDVLVLACDNTYDLVGQRHGGFLGIFQRALSRASDHIWFERGESKDRFAVAQKLRVHVEDDNKMPILIFPEGTCINNTSVMQFKKGTFEVGGVIYPVAIKYDPRFGDAFWNSSKYAMLSYIFMMMTSWAIVCDVWYLPPMQKQEKETSIQFANRVKAEIARKGGLVDLVWDGGLKRAAPKKEWMKQHQREYSQTLKLHKINHVKLVNKFSDGENKGALIEDETVLNKRHVPENEEEPSKRINEADVASIDKVDGEILPEAVNEKDNASIMNGNDSSIGMVNGIGHINGDLDIDDSGIIVNDKKFGQSANEHSSGVKCGKIE